jgi:hypothetical protein
MCAPRRADLTIAAALVLAARVDSRSPLFLHRSKDMSRNLPSGHLATIEWLEARLAAWSADPAGIGITPAQIADLTAQLDQARTLYTQSQELRARSKAKTGEFYGQATIVHTVAASMIQNIKAFAATAANPSDIYAQANLSSPAGHSRSAPPTRPTNFDFKLLANGSAKLMWEATGPTGTNYNITRRLSGETDFTFIGQGDGTAKSFVDATLPSGTAHAAYRIQGVRGALVGPQSTTFTIFFGTVSGAAAEAHTESTTPTQTTTPQAA